MPETPWYVYVVRCGDGTLYAGVTCDLRRRLAQHQQGRGARYTRGRGPLALVASWRFPDQAAALRAEAAWCYRHPAHRKVAPDLTLYSLSLVRYAQHGRDTEGTGQENPRLHFEAPLVLNLALRSKQLRDEPRTGGNPSADIRRFHSAIMKLASRCRRFAPVRFHVPGCAAGTWETSCPATISAAFPSSVTVSPPA